MSHNLVDIPKNYENYTTNKKKIKKKQVVLL